MNKYDFLIPRRRKQSLFIVEGNHEKHVLMKLLLKAFPEIDIEEEDILIFGTNIYMLYTAIEKEYDEDWDTGDVDLPFLVSKLKGYDVPLNKVDFNNIILMFDYERHDPSFSEKKIGRLQAYFTDSTDVGKLFINYPMIESYQDFEGWPGRDFEHAFISVTLQPGSRYKNKVKNTMVAGLVQLPEKLDEILEDKFSVNQDDLRRQCVLRLLLLKDAESLETKVEDVLASVIAEGKLLTAKFMMLDIIRKAMYCEEHLTYFEYVKKIFTEIIKQNIRKARNVVGESYDVSEDSLREAFEQIDLLEVLEAENSFSRDAVNGVIQVLNTSVLFVPDYSFSLIDG